MKCIIGGTHWGSWGASRAQISPGTNRTLENGCEQNLTSITSHLEPLSHLLAKSKLYPGRYGCGFIGLSICVHQHSVVNALTLKTHYGGFHAITLQNQILLKEPNGLLVPKSVAIARHGGFKPTNILSLFFPQHMLPAAAYQAEV